MTSQQCQLFLYYVTLGVDNSGLSWVNHFQYLGTVTVAIWDTKSKQCYKHRLAKAYVTYVDLQVHFPQAVCLTGLKVGAAPAAGGPLGTTPYVHIFANDLTTLGAARFTCLAEDCQLPESGTKAVRLEVSFQRTSCTAMV